MLEALLFVTPVATARCEPRQPSVNAASRCGSDHDQSGSTATKKAQALVGGAMAIITEQEEARERAQWVVHRLCMQGALVQSLTPHGHLSTSGYEPKQLSQG